MVGIILAARRYANGEVHHFRRDRGFLIKGGAAATEEPEAAATVAAPAAAKPVRKAERVDKR